MFSFKIHHKDPNTRARAGRMTTRHGEIETPIFMPVGTLGSVKAMAPEDLTACGARIILGNTYHLYLRPGCEVIARFGGLHRFMHWERPILNRLGRVSGFFPGQTLQDHRGRVRLPVAYRRFKPPADP